MPKAPSAVTGSLPLVGAACSATVRGVKDPPADLWPPLLTMTARPAAELPDEQHSGGYAFEPKLDGWLN
jgi:hypothetical protein